MKQKIVNYYLFAVLVALDQITKLIFSNRDFFVGPIHIHSVKNYGLAFSLNFGSLANIVLVAMGLFFFTNYYYRHQHEFSLLGRLSFVLIFAGAISNIFDRLSLGYVRDFLDLSLGFTFNLADTFVVVGLLILLFTQSKLKVIIQV